MHSCHIQLKSNDNIDIADDNADHNTSTSLVCSNVFSQKWNEKVDEEKLKEESHLWNMIVIQSHHSTLQFWWFHHFCHDHVDRIHVDVDHVDHFSHDDVDHKHVDVDHVDHVDHFCHDDVDHKEGGTAEVTAGLRDNFSQFLQRRRAPIFLPQLYSCAKLSMEEIEN